MLFNKWKISPVEVKAVFVFEVWVWVGNQRPRQNFTLWRIWPVWLGRNFGKIGDKSVEICFFEKNSPKFSDKSPKPIVRLFVSLSPTHEIWAIFQRNFPKFSSVITNDSSGFFKVIAPWKSRVKTAWWGWNRHYN